jgi:glutathione synthase/RimK-type ligase-like ATP-grasp enzyme
LGGTAKVDVVLLTQERYERIDLTSAYARQVLREETLLSDALERAGLTTARVAWSNPGFDASSTRVSLFRSTWDYFHRYAEFRTWLDRVEPVTRLVNAAPLVRWNSDKHYLRDLEQRGVRVVPTRYVEAGSRASLAEQVAELGGDVVMKPAVSGAARETYRVDAGAAPGLDAKFQSLLARETVLLQPFRHEIVEQGEQSLVVIGGRFTHAVRKVARAGDFRVQDDHGGTAHPCDATPDEIAFAERVAAAAPVAPTYARVDFIRTDEGPMLMELELIEPELFFRFEPAAATKLANEVVRLLDLTRRAPSPNQAGRGTRRP